MKIIYVANINYYKIYSLDLTLKESPEVVVVLDET